MIASTPADIRSLLERVTSIAMVGASDNPLRPSYTVFSYLRTQTRYRVVPINPNVAEIDGIASLPSLSAYADAFGPADLVDVFRRPADALAVTEEAIAAGARAIWYQYGVINQDAIARADAAGLTVVVDRCIKVEYARFCGGLASAGLNSGVITSRRRPAH
ncbi:MAG: CoA-binding protein [Candidatus Tumulicola sp.]